LKFTFLNLALRERSLVSRSADIESAILSGKENFENCEFSLNLDTIKTFFLGFIFIDNSDSLDVVKLMEPLNSVSKDFSNKASTLGSNTSCLEDDGINLFLEEESCSVSDVFSNVVSSSKADLVLRGLILLLLLSNFLIFSGS
jgi:hypothetical protein